MTKFASSLTIATLLALGISATPAHAQLSRTYVSAAIGNDANNCDRPTPCRTFQGAHNKTNPDGEITVLDPGGYGAVTITRSISIVNDGVGEASILVAGGATGITINAPPVAGYVNLRGITIQGIGFGGGTGLRFNSGFALTITNCVVRNHTKDGIDFVPTNSSSLVVSNTLIADNGGHGIFVQPIGSYQVKALLNRVESHNNSLDGILAMSPISGGGGWTFVNVVDSVVSNNSAAGFHAVSGSSYPGVTMSVTRSVATNNDIGAIGAGGKAQVVLTQSTLLFNGANWQGNFATYGDNVVAPGDPIPSYVFPKK